MDKPKNQAARQLAAMRKIYDHTCAVCNAEFKGTSRAVYCSNTCKQRAKNARNKAAKSQESS